MRYDPAPEPAGAGNGEWWLTPRADYRSPEPPSANRPEPPPANPPEAASANRLQPPSDNRPQRPPSPREPSPREPSLRRTPSERQVVPLHRTTGSLAMLLAAISALAAINGFRYAASAATEKTATLAGANLLMALLWAVGGLLLAQRVGYSRLIMTPFAVASLAMYADVIDVSTGDGNQTGALLAWAGLAFAALLVILLLTSATATLTRTGEQAAEAERSTVGPGLVKRAVPVLAVLLTCHAAGMTLGGILTTRWLGARDWSTGRLIVPMTVAHLVVAVLGVVVVVLLVGGWKRRSLAMAGLLAAVAVALNMYGIASETLFTDMVGIRLHQAGLGSGLIFGEYPGERLAIVGVVFAVLLIAMVSVSMTGALRPRRDDGHNVPSTPGQHGSGYS
ncbi:hypothetical protein [Nocardia asteroides]